jgi:hypothetical protein
MPSRGSSRITPGVLGRYWLNIEALLEATNPKLNSGSEIILMGHLH